MKIHILNTRKAGMHRTRIDHDFRRPEQMVEREFYSQHKFCYITHKNHHF